MVILLVLTQLSWAAGTTPMDIIRSGTAKVLSILRESEVGKAPPLKQRENEVLKVVSNYFDFDEMAKMALGYSWKQQSVQKREEFAALFKKLLFNTYVDRMENYHNQQIVFDSQTITGNLARVKTHFINNGESVPIDYLLKQEGAQWKVYDVVVEGISYDQNYRAQISAILANNSFDTLLGMLRAKVGQHG
jgi:phospholipid transport system substrate-binding protein